MTSRPEDLAGKPARLLGLYRSALIEIGLFLGAALAADALFFEGTRFRTVAPHPFWGIVLLMAVQYGTAEALVAAAASTLVLVAGNLPRQSIAQDSYDYFIGVAKEPLLWFVAAVVLGELRLRLVGRRQELQASLAESLQREEELAGAYRRLSALKDRLETRVAGQMRTAITMYQASRNLEKLDPSEVLLGVMDVVREIMNPEKFSVYLLQGERLEVSIGQGWGSDGSAARVYGPDSRLFEEVIGKQRVLCKSNPDDDAILRGEGVLAGPLVDNETGDVIGMLKIEKLGFFELHFSNIQTFKILCEWIANAYMNAHRYQEAQSESFLNPETRLFSYGFFERQGGYLMELAERIGFDLSMLELRIDNWNDLFDEQQSAVPAAVQRAVTAVLPKTDLGFNYRTKGSYFCLLLPGSAFEAARATGEKMVEHLESDSEIKRNGVRFSFAVQVLNQRKEARPRRETPSAG